MVSENDELVENAEHLPEVEESAGDEGSLPETAETLEDNMSAAEAAPEPVSIEYEEPAPDVVDDAPKVDLNGASEEELQALPGIGQALAARIVNHRIEVQPFQDPAEITNVPGVSDALYARIAPLVTAGLVVRDPDAEFELIEPETRDIDALVDELEPEVVEALDLEAEEEEAIALEPEPEAAEAEVKPPPGPEPPLVEVVQARVGWGRLLFVTFLSAILGALLALGLLAAVNGTLDFQSSAARVVQAEVVRLEGELEALNAKVEDVEGRLQAIQALDARLTGLEANVEQMADDLDATQDELASMADDLDSTQDQVASMAETMAALRQEFTNLREDLDGLADHVSTLGTRVDDMEGQLTNLNQEIEAISEATERFDIFLDGLFDLLGRTAGAGQGESPLGPALAQTPTLRPQVTVIPLATPTPTQ